MAFQLASIILPVHNQADHIEQLVSEYVSELASFPIPWEMILAVNGCTDHSDDVCRRIALRYPGVEVCQTRRSGWGLAIRTGLARARGDMLCYTNSARTTAPQLARLLRYGLANPESVIKATRKIRDAWQRRVGSLLFNVECRALFDLSYWDLNGTPKVFPRSFDRLLELSRDDDLIDVEFTVICRRENYPMLEVPFFSTRRHSGRSTTNYRSALRLYWAAFGMWRNQPEMRSR